MRQPPQQLSSSQRQVALMTLWPGVAAHFAKECREQLGALWLVQESRNGQVQNVNEHVGYVLGAGSTFLSRAVFSSSMTDQACVEMRGMRPLTASIVGRLSCTGPPPLVATKST